jgi:hypothetical protein
VCCSFVVQLRPCMACACAATSVPAVRDAAGRHGRSRCADWCGLWTLKRAQLCKSVHVRLALQLTFAMNHQVRGCSFTAQCADARSRPSCQRMIFAVPANCSTQQQVMLLVSLHRNVQSRLKLPHTPKHVVLQPQLVYNAKAWLSRQICNLFVHAHHTCIRSTPEQYHH